MSATHPQFNLTTVSAASKGAGGRAEATAAKVAQAETLGIRDVIAFLRSAAPLAIICGLVATMGTGYYVSGLPRAYTATAQVLHDPGASQIIVQDSFRRDTGTEVSRVEGQIQVLRSERISLAVIQRLGLIGDDEFRHPDDRGQPRSETLAAHQGAPELELGNPEIRYAIAAMQERMTVRRLGESFILEISFKAQSPEKAALIANAIADAYVVEDIRAKSDAARRSSEWLEERSNDLRQRAVDALRAAERFRASGIQGQITDARVQAAEFDSVSQASRRIYETFLQRQSEMAQFVSLPMADARVIATATAPFTHSDPKITLSAIFAGFVGTGLGTVLSLLRGALDSRIRNRRQIETLGIRLLGTIRRNGRRGLDLDAAGANPLIRLKAEEFTSLRQVRVAVHHSLPGGRARSIGIAPVGDSACVNGLALGLAALSALAGERTLLVDACPDGVGVSRDIVEPGVDGLMELIDDPSRPGAYTRPHSMANLHILPPGRPRHGVTPADKLGLRGIPLLDETSRHYDLVILAFCSVAASPDAAAVGPMLDGMVLVAQHGKTTREQLAAAIAALQDTNTALLGVVLEGVGAKASID